MGVIISKINDIKRISWTELRKGRVTAVKRALMVAENQVIIELANGQYTVVGRRHSPNGKWDVLEYGLDKFGSCVLDGLVRLGLLTKEQVRQHKEAVKRYHDERDRKWALRSLDEACASLGIPVPPVPDRPKAEASA